MPLLSEGSMTAPARRRALRKPVQQRPKLGCLMLVACAAALSLAACSNEPLTQDALWTGSTNARAATATSTGAPAGSATKTVYRNADSRGWGPYSGRRGQNSPPPEDEFIFKGDPNPSTTYAGGHG